MTTGMPWCRAVAAIEGEIANQVLWMWTMSGLNSSIAAPNRRACAVFQAERRS
jgi:hypothetical protein